MNLASEVQEWSNAPVPGQKFATKVSKSSAIPLYVPGVNPSGWSLISALHSKTDDKDTNPDCVLEISNFLLHECISITWYHRIKLNVKYMYRTRMRPCKIELHVSCQPFT